MADIVSPQVRSLMMAGIRGRDTKPELALRRGLHKEGFRYRLHVKDMLGRPDIVLPKFRAVIFVNGCFWHGHECPLFRWPSSRQVFWREKITRNKARDLRTKEKLSSSGWRVLTVWECAIKGQRKLGAESVIAICAEWINSDRLLLDISGKQL